MAKEKQERLSDEQIRKLIELLEKQGKEKWNKKWEKHIGIPQNLNLFSTKKEAQEKVLRYLLLRVLINQQAKSEKAREIAIRIVDEFRDSLLFEPFKISEYELFKIFKDIAGDKGSLLYQVGSLGGIKPISLFTYRFKSYEGFIKWLNKNNLNFIDIIIKYLKEPIELFNFLNSHPIICAGWVGNDPKACRMFVDWVIFIFNEIWKLKISGMEKTLMIVDGHVGKVFCRTGMLEEVVYENKRPYIINASKMRPLIESVIYKYDGGRIPFYIDNGAFYLFYDGYCTDLNPNCEKCSVGNICKKYIKWTAYKKWIKKKKEEKKKKEKVNLQ